MPKYVTITAYLSVDELANSYRKAADPIERSHFQIIWLLAQGKRVNQIAESTGYCTNWIRILARRYNRDGPQALADQRHQNEGATPLLSKEQQRHKKSRRSVAWFFRMIQRKSMPSPAITGGLVLTRSNNSMEG